MIVGQKVLVCVGGRVFDGFISQLLDAANADIRAKPGHPETFIVHGAARVDGDKPTSPLQFTLAEDDETCEMRLMEEADAQEARDRALAEAERQREINPPTPTPETQPVPSDEFGNAITAPREEHEPPVEFDDRDRDEPE